MNTKQREEIERWIAGDESGGEMLSRVSSVRPFLLPPPLHRVPLRVGNVLEVVGPSPSAKTHILIHTAITSILPKHYGGFDHLVLFLDLDCRFDIIRFSQLLIHRITQHRAGDASGRGYDKTLYNLCMARFLYARCSDSFEFLHTLRTLHRRIEKQKEIHGVGVLLLMIDSIGAFHWMDRASMFLSQRENNKNMEERCSKDVTRNHQNFQHREYMPSVWQSFVTHRILVRSSDDHPGKSNYQNTSFYLLEWLLPRLSFPDKIVVKDAGVFVDP
ncbi:DNA repair protein XRCC2 homolog isoform X3 [Abrus precatorius]|uniref:DNA repair protein XRCC2 homolog isoform X3 n=1 Tax=Abrus precatorius TaxID=3816 RepID=A0A8B8LBP7_ABRPR|nr:DNA repair protein XRCC2 homolog isoform X3 [Abrus precatorius]